MCHRSSSHVTKLHLSATNLRLKTVPLRQTQGERFSSLQLVDFPFMVSFSNHEPQISVDLLLRLTRHLRPV
jgi:hypothetical protein